MMISDILLSNKVNHTIDIFDNQNRFTNEANFIKNIGQFIQEDEIRNYFNLVFGLAKPNGKKFLFETYNLDINKFINLIHKSAEISEYTSMGVGVRIEPNVSIAGKTQVGNFVNINRNVSIGHDCIIEDFVTINPSCCIPGQVHIKEGSEIGLGVNILNNVVIGKNTIVGAGSLVTKNLPNNVVAYGSPCKIIKENK